MALVLMSVGMFVKPHRYWLLDCGMLVGLLNAGEALRVMGFHTRFYVPLLRRVQRICSFTGVSFGLGNSVFMWLRPFAFTMLLLSAAVRAAATILGTGQMLLRYVSDGSEILCLSGMVLFLLLVRTRNRSIKSILHKLDSLESSKPVNAPPKAAKFILLLVPRRYRENLIGDLEEEYITILLPEYGVRRARTSYWWQVAISIGPLLWAQMKRVVAISWLWKRVQ